MRDDIDDAAEAAGNIDEEDAAIVAEEEEAVTEVSMIIEACSSENVLGEGWVSTYSINHSFKLPLYRDELADDEEDVCLKVEEDDTDSPLNQPADAAR